MSFVSEIESVFPAGSLKWNRAIDEKDRVVYIVFFAEFREKLIRYRVCSGRFKRCVQYIV